VHFSGAFKRPSKWSDRPLGNRHIICAVEVKQAQGVFGAVMHIGITTNAGNRKKIDLGAHHRARNR
jgi:hypothetical protein